MATIRMIPPSGGATTKVNGRTYTSTGASVDVPDFDAGVLEGNGWTAAASGGVGATAARPIWGKAQKGQQFHDSTLGKNILWTGTGWVDPTNGNTV